MNRAVLLFTLVATSVAHATTVTYTDRASFFSAGSNWTVEDMEGILNPGQIWRYNFTSAGTDVGNVNMLGVLRRDATCGYCQVTYSTAIVSPNAFGNISPSSGAYGMAGFSATSSVLTPHEMVQGYALFTPLVTTHAFGFAYRGFEPLREGTPPVGFTVTLSNGFTYTGSADATPAYIGFVSTGPLAWVRVDYAQAPHTNSYEPGRLVFDDLTYSEVQTPEPTSFMLCAAALCVARFLRSATSRV